jgi:predicted MFS family arabinose efflux permease
MGLVGPSLFDRRQGRNQAFNSAGNVMAAVTMGLIGYSLSNRGIFFFVVAMAVPTLLTLLLIRPEEIDYELARGARPGEKAGGKPEAGRPARPARVRDLLGDRPLLIFLACCVLFHFANAAMLPLLGEMLSKGKGRSAMMFMAACVVTTQLVIALIAAPLGRLAGSCGRKAILLVGFGVLPVRGVLYTLTQDPGLLVGIQVLDGIGAGIFNVVAVLVIADLTRGTGRFNLAQGAIATAVGIGAALSQVVAGGIVDHSSYDVGFLFLAAVAAVGLALLWLFMPETIRRESGAGEGASVGGARRPATS